jgi:hypothetical protein
MLAIFETSPSLKPLGDTLLRKRCASAAPLQVPPGSDLVALERAAAFRCHQKIPSF